MVVQWEMYYCTTERVSKVINVSNERLLTAHSITLTSGTTANERQVSQAHPREVHYERRVWLQKGHRFINDNQRFATGLDP